jgi:hypothetical protein
MSTRCSGASCDLGRSSKERSVLRFSFIGLGRIVHKIGKILQ